MFLDKQCDGLNVVASQLGDPGESCHVEKGFNQGLERGLLVCWDSTCGEKELFALSHIGDA